MPKSFLLLSKKTPPPYPTPHAPLNSGPGALPLAGEGPGRGRAAPFLAKPHPFLHTGRLALDASAGNRRFDENGFLHVTVSHISKEAVNPYYGHEIPGWETLGLDPERIYHGWRAGAELAAGAATFNGLPLLLDHYVDSASDPQKEHRVGSLGTDAAFRTPYLDNSLIVTDAAAIAAIASGAARELSAAYMYDPVFAPGVFNGQHSRQPCRPGGRRPRRARRGGGGCPHQPSTQKEQAYGNYQPF